MAAAAGVELRERDARTVRMPVDVPADGLPVRVQWPAAAGATEARVDEAGIGLGPSALEENLGSLPVSVEGHDRLVTVPSGTRVRALTLGGLKTDNGTPAPSEAQLSGQARRLAVTVEAGGPAPAPQHAVPACPARGMVPASLTGASYASRVLRLPDVAGSRIRLSLVEGSFPEEFSKRAMALDSASGLGVRLPRNLRLLEPDGTTAVWQFPGEMPDGTPELAVDLRTSLTKLAASALGAGQPLDFTYRLRADGPARVTFRSGGARGALLRRFPGVLAHALAGDEAALALAGPALAAERPSRVRADLGVRYEGLRILDTVSDQVPAAAGDVGGLVVEAAPALRAFPPRAFDALAPARLGVVGRAPVECEISVFLVELDGGAPVAPPGVVRLAPSTALSTVWIELPAMAPPARPLACAVRATHGRFFWAAGTRPLVRVAVADPDPGGRPVLVNGQALVAMTDAVIVRRAHALPAAPFRNAPPRLSSDLFVSVDLADLTLEYAR